MNNKINLDKKKDLNSSNIYNIDAIRDLHSNIDNSKPIKNTSQSIINNNNNNNNNNINNNNNNNKKINNNSVDDDNKSNVSSASDLGSVMDFDLAEFENSI